MPSTTLTVLSFHLDENWHLAAERKVGKLDHRSSEDCCYAGIRLHCRLVAKCACLLRPRADDHRPPLPACRELPVEMFGRELAAAESN